jgi:predicted O-methyltransferase YrrM
VFSGFYDTTTRPTRQYRGVITTAQIEWELVELIKIYDRLKPRRVLEIGTQLGGTLYHWLEGAEPGAVICNIDILQNQPPEVAATLPDTWASWAPDGVEYHPIIGRSDDPAVFARVNEYLPDGIDFLFIDACHTYDGAKHDFLKYGPLVRPGGIIALHDLMTPEFSPHIQVWQLWREIQDAGYVTRELRAHADYGGIGIVYI